MPVDDRAAPSPLVRMSSRAALRARLAAPATRPARRPQLQDTVRRRFPRPGPCPARCFPGTRPPLATRAVRAADRPCRRCSPRSGHSFDPVIPSAASSPCSRSNARPYRLRAAAGFDLQHASDVVVGQHLEGPHQQDFAVHVGQLSQRQTDPLGEFSGRHLLAWRLFAGHQVLGQHRGGLLRQRQLAPHRPAGRSQVPAPHHDQAFVGHFPQPQVKRHRLPLEILRQPAKSLHLGILNHIGRIQSAPQGRIEPQADGGPQCIPVPREEPIKRGLSVANFVQQPRRFVGIGLQIAHQRVPVTQLRTATTCDYLESQSRSVELLAMLENEMRSTKYGINRKFEGPESKNLCMSRVCSEHLDLVLNLFRFGFRDLIWLRRSPR